MANHRDKVMTTKSMVAKSSRVTAKGLEDSLVRLGVSIGTRERRALFHLAEVSEIFETIQACLESIDRSSGGVSIDERLEVVSQVSQWLTDVQVDLFDHLQPMHLRPLRRHMLSLINAVDRLETHLGKVE